ncbi:mariner Mos1 transposase [Trichonephila clavipes]|nr:mariner Mos1 transposase [Trichonephila clavipes]
MHGYEKNCFTTGSASFDGNGYDTVLLEPTWSAMRGFFTSDETCARWYQPELKRQSNERHFYGSPRRSKFRQNPSNVKVMVILVYDCDGALALPSTILPSSKPL